MKSNLITATPWLYAFVLMVFSCAVIDAERQQRCLEEPPTPTRSIGCIISRVIGIYAYYKDEDRCLDKRTIDCDLVLTGNAFDLSEDGYDGCVRACEPGKEMNRCIEAAPKEGHPFCLLPSRNVVWFNINALKCEEQSIHCPKTSYNSFESLDECRSLCQDIVTAITKNILRVF